MALRKTKIAYNFGLSGCNRVKGWMKYAVNFLYIWLEFFLFFWGFFFCFSVMYVGSQLSLQMHCIIRYMGTSLSIPGMFIQGKQFL